MMGDSSYHSVNPLKIIAAAIVVALAFAALIIFL